MKTFAQKNLCLQLLWACGNVAKLVWVMGVLSIQLFLGYPVSLLELLLF